MRDSIELLLCLEPISNTDRLAIDLLLAEAVYWPPGGKDGSFAGWGFDGIGALQEELGVITTSKGIEGNGRSQVEVCRHIVTESKDCE